MSDFDKEAEREKLREKYERDAEERKATQRMSDLLLKGATMTNSHCGTCGDPLFQQEGTTFCPSCHGNPDAVRGTDLEVQPAEEMGDETAPERDTADGAGAGAADAAAADAAGDEASSEPPRTRSADSSAGGSSTDESAATIDVDAPSSSRDAPSSSSRETRPDAERSRTPSESAARDASGGSTDRRSSGERRGPARSSTPPADGDLEAAHASLVQAVEKFAEKAAATDDPRYARECLEAAREAGEALETLR